MPLGKLTRMSVKEDAGVSSKPLRTTDAEGFWMDSPQPDLQFTFCSKSLSPDSDNGVRVITTSKVVRVYLVGKDVFFDTQNSTYRLEEYPKA